MRGMTYDTERNRVDRADRLDPKKVEAVEVAADYRAELSVPFTSEQLAALERFAREERTSPEQAAQRLVERALAARSRR